MPSALVVNTSVIPSYWSSFLRSFFDSFRKRDSFGERFRSFDEFLEARPPGEPFCFWYGAGEPHRPYVWQASKKAGMVLKNIKVPACLPDNETVRSEHDA